MGNALALATVVVSGVVYHLAQKSAPAAMPWRMLAVAYGAAFVLTAGLALASGTPSHWQPGRREWTLGLLIGLAVLGIEAGFFFVYRAGWALTSASIVANLSVAALLALIGMTVFGEPLSASRALGLVLAACAVVLIGRG